MIARLWHGWTALENADAYETMLTTKVLPGIHRVGGFRGSQVLRRAVDNEVEFMTLTFFDSMDAVRSFAGADYEVAVVPPEARVLLSPFDEKSVHYETVTNQE